mgnify:CR=1 FL=1
MKSSCRSWVTPRLMALLLRSRFSAAQRSSPAYTAHEHMLSTSTLHPKLPLTRYQSSIKVSCTAGARRQQETFVLVFLNASTQNSVGRKDRSHRSRGHALPTRNPVPSNSTHKLRALSREHGPCKAQKPGHFSMCWQGNGVLASGAIRWTPAVRAYPTQNKHHRGANL